MAGITYRGQRGEFCRIPYLSRIFSAQSKDQKEDETQAQNGGEGITDQTAR